MICDIVESVGAATSTAPTRLTPAVLTSLGAANEALFTTHGSLLIATGAAVGGVVRDARGFLFTTTGHAVATPIMRGLLGDLLVQTGRGSDRTFRRLRVLHIDTAAVAATVFNHAPRVLITSTGHAVSSLLAGGTFKVLLTSQGSAASTALQRMGLLLVATGHAASTVFNTRGLMELVSEHGAASGSASSHAIMRTLVASEAHAASSIAHQHLAAYQLIGDEAWADGESIDNETSAWWTAETTLMAMSRYQTPRLNSIANLNGTLVAGDATGALALGFQNVITDDGVGFDSYVMTGIDKQGDMRMRRPDKAYCGYVSPYGVQVIVSETSTGNERSWAYPLPPRAQGAPATGRANLGQGLRAGYYRFTFHSINQMPFGLQDAQVTFLDTGRKF